VRSSGVVAVASFVTLLLGACAAPGPTAASGASHNTLTVFAAASLKGTFTVLAERFEQTHPNTTVTVNFAGSADLVSQVSAGAPADVLASADLRTMSQLAAAGLISGTPRNFATNTLAIAVPPGNPAGIRFLADLAAPGLKVVQCAPQVPCGAAAQTVEKSAGVQVHPVSEEQSVTDVLGKVAAGEADAGMVYATDVRALAGKVEGVDVPEAADDINTYPIATLANARQPQLAEDFVNLVLGQEGRDVLAGAGFGAPAP
jgi:molybdate transport system substrate-binding protein